MRTNFKGFTGSVIPFKLESGLSSNAPRRLLCFIGAQRDMGILVAILNDFYAEGTELEIWSDEITLFEEVFSIGSAVRPYSAEAIANTVSSTLSWVELAALQTLSLTFTTSSPTVYSGFDERFGVSRHTYYSRIPFTGTVEEAGRRFGPGFFSVNDLPPVQHLEGEGVALHSLTRGARITPIAVQVRSKNCVYISLELQDHDLLVYRRQHSLKVPSETVSSLTNAISSIIGRSIITQIYFNSWLRAYFKMDKIANLWFYSCLDPSQAVGIATLSTSSEKHLTIPFLSPTDYRPGQVKNVSLYYK